MRLTFNSMLAEGYKSQSQISRVLTEGWVATEAYCPNCAKPLTQHPSNMPVADFFCDSCDEDYELKSQQNRIGQKIVDGAYRTMIERLRSDGNPNFFFLNYNLKDLAIMNFLVIPKHFFVPEIIEKRKPLRATARRAGWVGCNILLREIPKSGRIHYVTDGVEVPKKEVVGMWQRSLFLREAKKPAAKGWIIEIMKCIDSLGKKEFSLSEMYRFERRLMSRFPDNRHIKDKIRQQLQLLRDRGYVEFISKGEYRLVNT